MWQDESCLPELSCLLPIAAFRCPKLLSSDILVFGLLPAQWGFNFLATVLLNNPLLARKSLFLLSDFLCKYKERSLSLDCKQMSTQILFPNKFSKRDMLHQQQRQVSIMVHSVKQAVLTFLHLGKLSSSLARLCRDVLVINCTCASVALHLTTEYIGDEIDFLSKLIFSSVKTSEWVLNFYGGSEKDEISNLIGLSDCQDGTEQLFLETDTNQSTSNALSGVSLRIRKVLLVNAQTTKEKVGWSGQLHGHLRLYCVLIWASDFQPPSEELEFWLKSLIASKGSLSVEMLQLGVAFFCLVPRLSATVSSKSLFQECVAVLLKPNIPREARYITDVEEQAIWFAVQLLLRQFSEIALVVREVIGAQVTIQSSQIEELHDAAMAAGVISEPFMLLWAIAGQRLKGPLSRKTRQSRYMLECLYQLLRSGHFSRNGIDVSETIAHVISVSRTPIDGMLVQVIQAYTQVPATVVHCTTGSQTFRMPPLSRSFVEESLLGVSRLNVNLQMDNDNQREAESAADAVAMEVLTTYYVLCRERILRSKGAGSSESSVVLSFYPLDSKENWWTALLLKIRFHELFQYMEERWLDFADILPQWFSLAASLFPERLAISDLLASLDKQFTMPIMLDNGCAFHNMECQIDSSEYPESEISSSCMHQGMSKKVPGTSVMLSMDSARSAMEDAVLNPKLAMQVLSALDHMPAEKGKTKELLDYQVFIIKELVPKLLDSKCSQCLQERFCSWFKNLEPLSRHLLLPAFMESILDTSPQQECDSKGGLLVVQLKAMVSELSVTAFGSRSSLLQQPLVLLACKPKVYQTPLLSTVLDLLQEFRTINRRNQLEIVSEGLIREQTIWSDEAITALLAQDSALCHILLEACLPHGDNIDPGPLLKAREIICGFLASLLETDHELLKLVHMQGYDPQLVSMMVKGVPAMVQCLEFAPELLQQQEPSKQIFAIILIADVACSYVELPESLVAVQKALAHVLLLQKSSLGSSSFMQGILEALVQCACTFSAVTANVRNILQRCLKLSRPLKRSHMPRDPALHNAIRSALRRICQKID
ncbi:hypothetical protein GOP47_0009822 [Adiantum capillus-veneris]|uniref:Uncharacterized protein n=1 Tax=Adiantum capillus-veneris TaxID=13818 RepID=A0A9D4ZJU8_ADICA|nr:hypothetical protein GOP47_0009822 [Adiantum capillus-veneris]